MTHSFPSVNILGVPMFLSRPKTTKRHADIVSFTTKTACGEETCLCIFQTSFEVLLEKDEWLAIYMRLCLSLSHGLSLKLSLPKVSMF